MKTSDSRIGANAGDLVLREVWNAKDTLSAAYGHDLDKLFSEIKKREKRSEHPYARIPIKRKKKKAA